MAEDGVQRIGRFELVRSLGRGSQGAVYLARDPTLDRFVAIKVLAASDAELQNSDDDGTPLEARIAGRLKHPNIVPIYDTGECVAGPYLVFEYVEGDTLADVLKENGPYSVREGAPLIAAILQALGAAHGAGIAHLDLSPRNVLLDRDGTPRVMDFGLSQFTTLAHESGDVVTGTLRYLSPEHFAGEPLGPWTDVFALGSTFFALVTGEHAMQGQTIERIREQIVSGNVDLAALHVHEHGEPFARFLKGALEKDRAGRYADCSVMYDAFRLFLNETGLSDRSSAAEHSTVEFLLQRMKRKQDFPTISTTLADINRLTGDDALGSADKLANVILRDMALTSKLLKLVNSPFYGTRAAEITSISQAVVFLGLKQIRMTANGLTLFGRFKSDSAELKDSMTKSFLAGLIARHLAKRDRLLQAEEAFICGMFQNLGENLVIYYFPDVYEDITSSRQENGLDKLAASRGVLGVSFADLGSAVAATWNLPESIVDSIKGLPPGPVEAPPDGADGLVHRALFANEVCDIFLCAGPEEVDGALLALVDRFRMAISIDHDYAAKLVSAGFEKLRQHAPLFEIDVDNSKYCRAVQRWLDQEQEAATEDARAVNSIS